MRDLRHVAIRAFATLGLLALSVAAVLIAPGAHAMLLRGSVLGNGALPAAGATGGGRILYGTVGQPVVGVSGGGIWILCHGYWCFGGARVIAVEPPQDPKNLPITLSFGHPTPNPARGQVSFALALPKPARVELGIYDVRGRLVQNATGDMEAGWHTLRWDGTDASGRSAGTGVYFARLRVDGEMLPTRQIVRL